MRAPLLEARSRTRTDLRHVPLQLVDALPVCEAVRMVDLGDHRGRRADLLDARANGSGLRIRQCTCWPITFTLISSVSPGAGATSRWHIASSGTVGPSRPRICVVCAPATPAPPKTAHVAPIRIVLFILPLLSACPTRVLRWTRSSCSAITPYLVEGSPTRGQTLGTGRPSGSLVPQRPDALAGTAWHGLGTTDEPPRLGPATSVTTQPAAHNGAGPTARGGARCHKTAGRTKPAARLPPGVRAQRNVATSGLPPV